MKNIILLLCTIFLIAFTACTTNRNMSANNMLAGEWELVGMPAAKEPLKMKFPNRMPYISFDAKANRISGNTSCNSFSGDAHLNGNKLDLSGPMITTRMACIEGMGGEQLFLNMLKIVNNYSIKNDMLLLKEGDTIVTTYKRKTVAP